MEILRISTIHPIFVHATLGLVPALLVAYAVGLWRKSAAWTFAGDVMLGLAALVTLATAVFGLVSNWTLAWPSDLGTWRWVHLAGGAVITLLLLGMAAVRLRNRAARPLVGNGVLAAAVVLNVVAVFAGWVGGEVLVYHAGMAVKGAANGALAPALTDTVEAPDSVHEAMEHFRGAWAEAVVLTGGMIVERPRAEDFEVIERRAREVQGTARWLATEGPESLHEHGAEEGGQSAEGGRPVGVVPVQAGQQDPGKVLARHGEQLERRATRLAQAARARSIEQVSALIGETSTVCASCHAETRWR